MTKNMINPPVLVPTAVRINEEKIEKGTLNVEIKRLNLKKDDLNQPQRWIKKLFRKVENSFITKMEAIALTGPIVRPKTSDIHCEDFTVTVVAVDVSPVFVKEGL